jgi:hypothetical protein
MAKTITITVDVAESSRLVSALRNEVCKWEGIRNQMVAGVWEGGSVEGCELLIQDASKVLTQVEQQLEW